MKRTQLSDGVGRLSRRQRAEGATVRLCATVEPDVLEDAQLVAKLSGFRFSFSAYINDLMKRDVQQRRQALIAAQCVRA